MKRLFYSIKYLLPETILCIFRGIKYSFMFFNTMKHNYVWDYSSVYRLLYKQLELMEQCFINTKSAKYHVDSIDKTIKEINICRNLCKRIITDEYCLNDNKVYLNKNKDYKQSILQLEQDIDLLFAIMKKKSRTWWS